MGGLTQVGNSEPQGHFLTPPITLSLGWQKGKEKWKKENMGQEKICLVSDREVEEERKKTK